MGSHHDLLVVFWHFWCVLPGSFHGMANGLSHLWFQDLQECNVPKKMETPRGCIMIMHIPVLRFLHQTIFQPNRSPAASDFSVSSVGTASVAAGGASTCKGAGGAGDAGGAGGAGRRVAGASSGLGSDEQIFSTNSAKHALS